MKITWYGHAAFKILTGAGTRIIIDPYEHGAFGGALSYGKITDEADIVLTSHDHADHGNVRDIKGTFTRINKAGVYEMKELKITAFPTFHDPFQGKERGANLLFLIEADDLRLVHMGDLGHILNDDTAQVVGSVDILLVPVGGFYTIDAHEASEVVNTLKPRIVIPMHFKTRKCDFPIAPVEEFTKGRTDVQTVNGAELEVTKESLPVSPRVMLLKYAL
jgi:L-ascorbate metabolism protein UlaG (beta-lactamase superfamily)